jgi:hypothetical protein
MRGERRATRVGTRISNAWRANRMECQPVPSERPRVEMRAGRRFARAKSFIGVWRFSVGGGLYENATSNDLKRVARVVRFYERICSGRSDR